MNRSLSAPRLAQLLGDFPRTPAYRGLRLALQQRIGDGRIPLGMRLPSERDASAALAVSRGAGAGAQNAIGIAVIGGVLAATVLGVMLVPVFFVLIAGRRRRVTREQHPAAEIAGGTHA